MELMGSAIIQVVCGRRHMVVVAKNGRVQACGLGAMGQLGIAPPPVPPSTVPKVVRSPWQVTINICSYNELYILHLYLYY